MTAALAIAAAAGLAALGAARQAKRGSRADQPHGQRFLGRFDRVSPGSNRVLSTLEGREAFLDDMENNAGVLEQILPGVSGRHKDFELQIKDSSEPNAWYFGGSLPIFRFTSSPLSPGFISHQSIHMLDDEGKQWGSLVPNSPSRRLVQETSDLIRPHIDAYVDRKLEQGISHLPAKLREALLAGPVPWRDAHAILIEHHGSPYSVKEVGEAISNAFAPFGGLHRFMLEERLGEDPGLIDSILSMSRLIPVGVPMSLHNKPAELKEYTESYRLSNLKRALLDYTLDSKEVFARLVDQIVREEALRKGRPMRRIDRQRPDDVPLALLPQVEDKAWAVTRQRGWSRR